MSEEVEKARPSILEISLREICHSDGEMERRVDFNINDLLLAFIVVALMALAVSWITK
ncbi:MAG: hypothetical protein QMD80_09295 [archaeon]|nr:hypothetical protein [archaeon]